MDEKHDANWLVITVNVQLAGVFYSASSPCSLTWEVGWIAMWLQNVARDVPQPSEIDGIEPGLSFEHVRTDGEMVTIRIRAQRELSPVSTDRVNEGIMDFTVPRSQVEEAAASLRAELRLFPPRAGAETRPPFTVRERSSSFFFHWLLVVSGTTADEAMKNAVDYMHWLHLEPVVQSSGSPPERPGGWHVHRATRLPVPRSDPFQAVFELLSHLPTAYGAPRLHRPYLRPDGVLTCSGGLAPREDAEEPFSRIRGWFELTNDDGTQLKDRYHYLAGKVYSYLTCQTARRMLLRYIAWHQDDALGEGGE